MDDAERLGLDYAAELARQELQRYRRQYPQIANMSIPDPHPPQTPQQRRDHAMRIKGQLEGIEIVFNLLQAAAAGTTGAPERDS